MEFVDNTTVRQAVGAFAANPQQRAALEVLRACMYGSLLFDTTGSDMFVKGGQPLRKGSELRIQYGTGPDGGRALFAFTRQEEINRMYAPDFHTQSLVTPATGALELARQQSGSWLYIDPAGPTCALSAAEIDFALRNPNNEPIKEALAALSAGQTDRSTVLQLLRTEGPMVIGAHESAPGDTGMRGFTHPDGSTSLLGFTSGPEVLAFTPSDAVASFTTAEVLDLVCQRGYRGLIVNPAGPSITFSTAELCG